MILITLRLVPLADHSWIDERDQNLPVVHQAGQLDHFPGSLPDRIHENLRRSERPRSQRETISRDVQLTRFGEGVCNNAGHAPFSVELEMADEGVGQIFEVRVAPAFIKRQRRSVKRAGRTAPQTTASVRAAFSPVHVAAERRHARATKEAFQFLIQIAFALLVSLQQQARVLIQSQRFQQVIVNRIEAGQVINRARYTDTPRDFAVSRRNLFKAERELPQFSFVERIDAARPRLGQTALRE
ncbi:MAG: hypothetical protein JMDDDDMK_01339 [Acidobacteria bacterium]|nr:hypothetical protein [Acidobacteriota bacterium]